MTRKVPHVHNLFEHLITKSWPAGIVFEAYAPIGSPSRSFKQDAEPVVMEDPVVKTVAEKHNATPAQVTIA